MIYLKRLWNCIVFLFSTCVFILITTLTIPVEMLIIAPIFYIFKNENYTEIYAPFSFRVMWWMKSKLMFNTNKK